MSTVADFFNANEKMTDALLAEELGFDRSMITKIRGGKATPSLGLAISISKRTGVPVEALMPKSENLA